MAGEIIAVGLVSYDHVVLAPSSHGGAATRCSGQAGGLAARAAIAARRLGGRVQLFARIGDDAFGNLVALELRRNGVETSQLAVLDGARTPIVTVVQEEGKVGSARFFCPGEGMDSGWETPEYWRIDRAGAVFVDGCWPAVCLAAVRRAKACGVPSIAAIGPGGQDASEIYSLADYPVLSAGSDAAALASSLLEGRAKAVVLRHSDGDVEVLIKGGTRKRLAAVSAGVGEAEAGWFHGAFVHRVAQGWDIERAVEYSSVAAARPGADPEEIDELNAAGQPRWTAS